MAEAAMVRPNHAPRGNPKEYRIHIRCSFVIMVWRRRWGCWSRLCLMPSRGEEFGGSGRSVRRLVGIGAGGAVWLAVHISMIFGVCWLFGIVLAGGRIWATVLRYVPQSAGHLMPFVKGRTPDTSLAISWLRIDFRSGPVGGKITMQRVDTACSCRVFL
ncbi:hypothetical protein [Bradyrhizobium australiense]|uniref:Uncharacterized protein n=1 Tax=Bradyrhizobium australiense TaxID=2721161 RepID=A0A7Y4GXC7_9BRAD|nr:hypothetical protein [Bradyrhizobium australiense]NOJ43631.1 hypothetical protein [Bradyrhizobium australiense]